MSPRPHDWPERSRVALAAALDDLRARLQRKAAGEPSAATGTAVADGSALARVIRKFHLSPFERDLLLLAAGVEVDSRFAALVSGWHGNRSNTRPTCSLALSHLEQPHWSALSPDAVLRRARLVRLADGTGLVAAAVVIDECVLHALNGLVGLDERLRPFVTLIDGGPLVPSHERAAVQIAGLWAERRDDLWRQRALVATSDRGAAADMVARASAMLDLTPFAIDLSALPSDRAQLEELIGLWERDAVLHDFSLLVDASGTDSPDRRTLAGWMLDRLTGFVAVVGESGSAWQRRAMVQVAPAETTPGEQAGMWQAALGPLAASLDGQLGRLTEQFRLPPRAIVEAARELRATTPEDPGELQARAWDICRRQSRGGLDHLAQRLEPRATWDRLVLPLQMDLLRSIATQARHRFQVYERWGFRAQSSRGFGLSALFHGPSGVGKTFSAEVLANDLRLDLYRVDLSLTISKYIGETEKNLRRIFDAAEQSGAILLFDEADALFGKRSEVSDSHDRYANLEVSYLLQRMETYRGLAVLTTNQKSALDQAFLRRLRFVVPFPFPSAVERERIWRHAFPAEVPLAPGVDWEKLARLAVSGGNIANISLDAAFRAAHDGASVTMAHLLAAARTECAKIEKPISDVETRGWV